VRDSRKRLKERPERERDKGIARYKHRERKKRFKNMDRMG
jgi:hypothetical protein